jgi:hypothetical protein
MERRQRVDMTRGSRDEKKGGRREKKGLKEELPAKPKSRGLQPAQAVAWSHVSTTV